ncbi:MAG: hypothetical protein KGL34_01150 [Gammaproteobacteria bacterium]|nr:hypothetical protein [Gammaproteobacteria bacterium]
MTEPMRRGSDHAPRPAAARDVLLALALKAGLLSVLYLMFFGPAHRPPADSAAVAAALTGPSNREAMR